MKIISNKVFYPTIDKCIQNTHNKICLSLFREIGKKFSITLNPLQIDRQAFMDVIK